MNSENDYDEETSGFAGGISTGPINFRTTTSALYDSDEDDDDDSDDDGPSRRVDFAPMQSLSMGPIGAAQPHSMMPAPFMMATAPSKTIMQAAAPLSMLPPPVKVPAWTPTCIPTLPETVTLEKTSVFLEYTKDPAPIAERIVTALTERFVDAEYNDSKACVSCITADYAVEFNVNLFRGRGSYSHGIIVEVQRTFGTSADYAQDFQAVLDAAQGLETPPPPPSMFGARTTIPMVEDSDDEGDYMPSPPSSSSKSSSLEMIASLLAIPGGYDSHFLAYQMLGSLVDSSKMGASTAKAVSQELLLQGNAVGNHIRKAIVVECNKQEDTFKLRPMAMMALLNALENGARPNYNCSDVVAALQQEAQAGDKNINKLAAKCLELIR